MQTGSGKTSLAIMCLSVTPMHRCGTICLIGFTPFASRPASKAQSRMAASTFTRYGFRSRLLEYGANPKAVQAILGHSTLAMTMDVYAKATERSKRAAISVLPFAKASGPDHVLDLEEHSGYKCAQESAQVISAVPNPLCAKTLAG